MTRRMFSPLIIDSDAFLDMPQTAQNLYFHLGMRADDDGFVDNPKKILRMIGSNEDDLKLLLAKRFILSFESGIIVIKHWRINNYIRKDIYEPTKYLEEKKQLLIKKNGSYTFNKEEGEFIPDGHFTLEDIGKNACTQRALPVPLGKVRIGKVRIGKVRIGKKEEEIKSKKFQKPSLEDIKTYCQERNNHVDPSKFLNHYESNGWRVGKNPMKDWKAAVRTWEGNNLDGKKTYKVVDLSKL